MLIPFSSLRGTFFQQYQPKNMINSSLCRVKAAQKRKIKEPREVLTVSSVCSKHVMTMSASPASSYISSGTPFLSTSPSISAQGMLQMTEGACNEFTYRHDNQYGLPHGNEPGDQFLLVARIFTPNGFNLLAISTPIAPNPRIRT
jgi:hypothetical protein